MKCLINCQINNHGPGWRGVRFGTGLGPYYEVQRSACRKPDGSPCPPDWPAMWDDSGGDIWADGQVQAELVEAPATVHVNLGGSYRNVNVPGSAVVVDGSRGKPAYRLAIMDEMTGED